MMQKTNHSGGELGVMNTRILIVDDHGSLRKSMADFLRRQEGVEEVREAANGVDALKCLHEGRYDILVTDIVMPMMDGYMLLEDGVFQWRALETGAALDGYPPFKP